MFTPDELSYLNDALNPQAPAPAPAPEESLWARAGKHLANLPSNLGNAVLSDIGGIADMINREDFYPDNVKFIPKPFDIAPAKTTGQGVVDAIGGELVPELVEWALPYGAVGKVAKGAGIARGVGLESTKQALASLFQSANYGKEEAVNNAIWSAVGGSMEKFTRAKRLLPALLAAGGEAGSNLAMGASGKDAAVMAAVSFLGNMAPGQFDVLEKQVLQNAPTPPVEAPHVNPEEAYNAAVKGQRSPNPFIQDDLRAVGAFQLMDTALQNGRRAKAVEDGQKLSQALAQAGAFKRMEAQRYMRELGENPVQPIRPDLEMTPEQLAARAYMSELRQSPVQEIRTDLPTFNNEDQNWKRHLGAFKRPRDPNRGFVLGVGTPPTSPKPAPSTRAPSQHQLAIVQQPYESPRVVLQPYEEPRSVIRLGESGQFQLGEGTEPVSHAMEAVRNLGGPDVVIRPSMREQADNPLRLVDAKRGPWAGPSAPSRGPILTDETGALKKYTKVGDAIIESRIDEDGTVSFAELDKTTGKLKEKIDQTGEGAFRTMNALQPALDHLMDAALKRNPAIEFMLMGSTPTRSKLYDRILTRNGMEPEKVLDSLTFKSGKQKGELFHGIPTRKVANPQMAQIAEQMTGVPAEHPEFDFSPQKSDTEKHLDRLMSDLERAKAERETLKGAKKGVMTKHINMLQRNIDRQKELAATPPKTEPVEPAPAKPEVDLASTKPEPTAPVEFDLSIAHALAEANSHVLSKREVQMIGKLTQSTDPKGLRKYVNTLIDDAELHEEPRLKALDDILKSVDNPSPAIVKQEFDDLDEATEIIMDRMMESDNPDEELKKIAKEHKFKLKGKDQDEKIFNLAMRMSGVGGQAATEFATSLGLGVASGLYGYAESEGDIGAGIGSFFAGMGIGLVGLRALKNLRNAAGSNEPKAKAKVQHTEVPTDTLSKKISRFAKETATDLSARSVNGRGGIIANSVHVAENMLGINMPWAVNSAHILSKGAVTLTIDRLQQSINEVRHLKPTEDFKRQAGLFLKGQLLPKSETDAILATGSMKGKDFGKLDRKARKEALKQYSEKWLVRNPDESNTTGEGVELYRVTPETKQRLLSANYELLEKAAAGHADNLGFLQLPVHARESFDELMGFIADALPTNSAEYNKIIGTAGQYQSRTFEFFTNPRFYPEEDAIQGRMDELAEKFRDTQLSHLVGSGKVSDADTGGLVPVTIEGKTKFITSDDAEVLDLYNNRDFLRKEVEEELSYMRRNKQMFVGPQKSTDIDSSLFKKRKQLTPAQRRMLGEHTDVMEETVHTINRLASSAEAGKFISIVSAKPLDSGLMGAYKTPEAYLQKLNSVQVALNQAVDPEEISKYQIQLNKLKAYKKIGADIRMGMFENSYVDPFVYHQLKDFRSPFGILENPIGKGFAKFNNIVKQNKTLYNPITHVRNIVTVPFFLAMADATDPSSMATAAAILANRKHPLRDKINRLGILDATQVRGEFNINTRELVNGDYDSTVYKKLMKAHHTVAEIYNIPDAFVRVTAFLSAEKRMAKKLGKAIDDPAVQDAALRFVERRTMNYANVPDAVKVARQLPFVNMFISYAYEIARISKNMAVDAYQGDYKAGAVLGGLVAAPFVLQAAAESQLSEEDRKAWKLANRLSPGYSRSRFKIPFGKDQNGNFHYADITPIVPHDSYLQLARAIAKGDAEGVAQVNPWIGWDNTPAFSIISEQVAGRDSRTRRDFRDNWDRLNSVIEEIAPPETPGFGYEWKKTVQAWSRNAEGNRGITNQKTGRTETIKGWLSRHLVGVNPSSVNPEILRSNAFVRTQRQIANERAYLNDILRSNATEDEKNKARRTFKEAAMIHAENLRNELGLPEPTESS